MRGSMFFTLCTGFHYNSNAVVVGIMSMALCVARLACILMLESFLSLFGRLSCQDIPTQAAAVCTRHAVVAKQMIVPFFKLKTQNTIIS